MFLDFCSSAPSRPLQTGEERLSPFYRLCAGRSSSSSVATCVAIAAGALSTLSALSARVGFRLPFSCYSVKSDLMSQHWPHLLPLRELVEDILVRVGGVEPGIDRDMSKELPDLVRMYLRSQWRRCSRRRCYWIRRLERGDGSCHHAVTVG